MSISQGRRRVVVTSLYPFRFRQTAWDSRPRGVNRACTLSCGYIPLPALFAAAVWISGNSHRFGLQG
ncbi:hypothetical protein BD311DRAFT_768389, partial [Dichomitus squalens]